MARLFIISKARDLDLKETIGKFEYSAIPLSNFAPDGQLLLQTHKAKEMHALENLAKESVSIQDESEEEVATTESPNKVLIIEGMAIVNCIKKTSAIKYVEDFAKSFLDIVGQKSSAYNEVRVIFDRHLELSLKQKIRNKRIDQPMSEILM